MTTEPRTGSAVIATAFGIGIVFLASSCSQSTSSATQPTASTASSPTPVTPPPGGPVPAQLIGVWILHTPNLDPDVALSGIINGKVQLTLTATTWSFQGVNNNPIWGDGAPFFGDAVVNNSEFDIYNGAFCGRFLPGGGVGRYTWMLTGGILHFAPLVAVGYHGDPCSHFELQNTSYIRTG